MIRKAWRSALAAIVAISIFAQADNYAEERLTPEVCLLTVDEAIRFGILHSTALRYARMGAIETMRLKKSSIRGFLPKLGISYSESDNVRVGFPDSREKRLEASLTQLVFDGGKSALEHELGEIAASYAYRDCLEQEKRLEARIAGEYLDLALRKANLGIQDELLRSSGEQLAIAKAEYENGVALESDYLECVINRSGVEYDRLRLAREYESAERRFKLTLGVDEAIGLAIGGFVREKRDARALSENVDAICARSLAVNSELARKREDLRMSEMKARRGYRVFAPSVSLRCSLSFSGESFPLTEPSINASVILGFDNPAFPVSFTSGYAFSGGKLGSASNSAEVSLLDSITWGGERRLEGISILRERGECERAERESISAIRDEVYSRDDAMARLAIKAESVALMERKTRISEERATRGELSRVDLLEEMIALAKARIDLLSIEAELASLERSLAIALDIPFGEDLFEIK